MVGVLYPIAQRFFFFFLYLLISFKISERENFSMTKRYCFPTTILVAIALFALFLCLVPHTAGAAEPKRIAAVVERIVDGDTIKVTVNGLPDTVRFIGIDTPESKRNQRAELQAKEEKKNLDTITAMGKQASKHLASMLRKGDAIELELDAEPRDRYGRVLAYVYKNGRMINADMIADGYAYPLTIPPNVRHEKLFRTLFAEARSAGRGLWKE